MAMRRLFCIAALGLLSACGSSTPPAPQIPPPTPTLPTAGAAGELRKAVEADPELKALLVRAIEEGRRINPDPRTNPAQTLEQYYDFVAFAERALPSSLIPSPPDATLYRRIDQSLGYLFFISDIPLDELKGRGYFNNSLQYTRAYGEWLRGFVRSWGKYLDTPASWNAETLRLAQADPAFGLKQGWYESPDNWKTFNQFFARRLASPDKRPIASPTDDAVLVSPVDALPMGKWAVGPDSRLVDPKGVAVKSASVQSVEELLEASPYAKAFAGGTFTHLFLDVNDYHRYHFPLSGTIWELGVIPGHEFAGGFTTWDAANQRYKFDPSSVGWQSIETRGLVVLQSDRYGLVALLPIGMSPVSSVNFEPGLKEGSVVKKGDPMGHFLFGGSDFIIVFQKGVDFTLEKTKHVLMGERIGRLAGGPAK